MQRRRGHLHRPGDDGWRQLPSARTAKGSGSRHRYWITTRRPRHQRGTRDVGRPRPRSSSAPARPHTPAAHVILEPARRRRARLPQHRPAAHHAVRRRAAAAQAGRRAWAEKGGVYVLDEPTTGLHLADVEQLLGLLDRLVDSGKSVIVIEHHQAVMAHADWIIDLGPGAGHDGGRIVFEGTPARPRRRPLHAHRRASRGLRRRLTELADSVRCRPARGPRPAMARGELAAVGLRATGGGAVGLRAWSAGRGRSGFADLAGSGRGAAAGCRLMNTQLAAPAKRNRIGTRIVGRIASTKPCVKIWPASPLVRAPDPTSSPPLAADWKPATSFSLAGSGRLPARSCTWLVKPAINLFCSRAPMPAVPMTVPTWRLVLKTPEAAPAIIGLTLRSATVDHRRERAADADARDDLRQEEVIPG